MRRLFTACLLTGLALTAPAARSTAYHIAAYRSHADFAVRLLWLHTINGRFTQIAGQLQVDPRGLATVDARITVDSLVMDSARFRRWVMAREFFDAAQYPTIHFVSDPIALTRLTAGGMLGGRLSLRGVTQPVRFELMPAVCSTRSMTDCVIEAHGTVSRSVFGMSGHSASLSDQVQLGLWITFDHSTD
jgi:polyisoprenoid-binding protein YceI